MTSVTWQVLFTSESESQVRELIKDGNLDEDDRRIIAIWIKQVKKHGPDSLRAGKNIWYDHDLFGKWSGFRSSAFSHSGRILYRVFEDRILVTVVRVTHDHDYKFNEEK